jgi:hypothetical protein
LDGDQRIAEAIQNGELGDLDAQAPVQPEPNPALQLEVMA